ncbi:MAG TPA: response regulator [Myxococcaceae bacterium]|nr:response regulator [Myxococcaceae bacterium]
MGAANLAIEAESEMVLLVEPDEELRERAAEALREDGFRVVEVEDGLELLDYLEALAGRGPFTRPDVIVSEMELPGTSALDCLWRFRQSDRVTPVILIASEGEDGERAQRCGADLVLPWPLDIDQLRTAVTVTA